MRFHRFARQLKWLLIGAALVSGCQSAALPLATPPAAVSGVRKATSIVPTTLDYLPEIERLLERSRWRPQDKKEAESWLERVSADRIEMTYDVSNPQLLQATILRWKLVLRLGQFKRFASPRRLELGPPAEVAERLNARHNVKILVDPNFGAETSAYLSHLSAALEDAPAAMKRDLAGLPIYLSNEMGNRSPSYSYDGNAQEHRLILTSIDLSWPRTEEAASKPGAHYVAEGWDVPDVPTLQLSFFHELCHAWESMTAERDLPTVKAFDAIGKWDAELKAGDFLAWRIATSKARAHRSTFVSGYAHSGSHEDFAETGMYFRYKPAKVLARSPERFAYLTRVWRDR
jgi:hypothetical protein